MRPRACVLVVLALLAPALSAAPALASAVPDSAARAALQRQVGHLGQVRIAGPAGNTLLAKPVVREDGLHMRQPWRTPRPALVVIGDVPAPPPPVGFVPWSEIDEVQVPRGDPVRGFLSGAIFGAGVAAIIITVHNGIIREAWDESAQYVVAGTAIVIGGCATAGAVVGSYTENWRSVYPAPPPSRP